MSKPQTTNGARWHPSVVSRTFFSLCHFQATFGNAAGLEKRAQTKDCVPGHSCAFYTSACVAPKPPTGTACLWFGPSVLAGHLLRRFPICLSHILHLTNRITDHQITGTMTVKERAMYKHSLKFEVQTSQVQSQKDNERRT